MSSYLTWLNYGCYGITAVFTGVVSQAIAAARPAPPQLDGESHSVGILYTLHDVRPSCQQYCCSYFQALSQGAPYVIGILEAVWSVSGLFVCLFMNLLNSLVVAIMYPAVQMLVLLAYNT
jgi:hypothetical protein